MKNPFLYFVTVVAFLMVTSTYCEGKGKPDIIQFVPSNHIVEISLVGSGKAIIDWGDGKKSKKRLSSTSKTFRHSTGASNRFITISGKNLLFIIFLSWDESDNVAEK